MSAAQTLLTAEQLAAAYNRLNARERRSFLAAVVAQPTHQKAARALLQESRATLQKKFSVTQQRELDRLLDKNNEGQLQPAEQVRLEELMNEYGATLVEKARAQYVLTLAQAKSQSD